jgi:response regulator RpfG family c-di-GMP phosphodiesterase
MRGPAARRRTARTMARTNEGALSDEEVRAVEGAASLWDTGRTKIMNFILSNRF